MNRFFSILLNAARVLSLLLCVATVAAWIWSFGARRHIGLSTLQARYSLQSERGRLTLTGPPSAMAAEDGVAWKLVSELRNDQFSWTQHWYRGLAGSGTIQPEPIPGSPADLVRGAIPQSCRIATSTGMHRALLRALDDPGKFVAAHCLLVYAQTPRRFPLLAGNSPPGPWRSFDLPAVTPTYGVVPFDGLKIEFKREGAVIDDSTDHDTATERRVPTVEFRSVNSWDVKPDQLPAIRDQWHDRLDVRVGSMPYWPLLIGSLMLPVAWCSGRWRRVRRRRAGKCLGCGYDVRATPDRCPECGMALPAAVVRLPALGSM